MSPCTLFSCSGYLRNSGAWLALSASDFLRSARLRGELPVCVVLATGRGHGTDKRGQCRIGLDGSPPSVA